MATAQATTRFTGKAQLSHAILFCQIARQFVTATSTPITDAQRPTFNSATLTRNGGTPADVTDEKAVNALGISDGDTLTIDVNHDLDYVAQRIADYLARAVRHPHDPTATY